MLINVNFVRVFKTTTYQKHFYLGYIPFQYNVLNYIHFYSLIMLHIFLYPDLFNVLHDIGFYKLLSLLQKFCILFYSITSILANSDFHHYVNHLIGITIQYYIHSTRTQSENL